ncbi:MAG: hypothetical protein ACLFQB_11095 [Chitinispirillaceae bacterium]
MMTYRSKTRSGLTLSLVLLLCAVTADLHAFTLSGVSWLGGSGDDDMAVGTCIQSQGTIVIAANINDASPGDATPALLNDAAETSSGAVIIVNENGTEIISVTRVASEVLDMATDSDDNIYIAAAQDGILKLDPSAQNLVYKKECGGYCLRLDAAEDGTVAGLNASGSNSGTIYVYDNEGTELGSFSGHRKTQDVAVSSTHNLVYYTGFRNANTSANPVQVCYIKACSYQGEEAWTNYDWPAHLLDNSDGVPYGEVKPENNMADTRGYRLAIGLDGYLYAAFESAGGNHIFRYAPRDIMTKVTVVGGDMWHNWYNTKSEHKTFFGRYDAQTGDYVLGQQFCTRYYDKNKDRFNGNTMRVRDGNITADEHGRVYLVGPSASGLPMDKATGYSEKEDEVTYNPFDEKVYTGGAYLLIMSSDLSQRLYCTRLSGGSTRGVAVRNVDGNTTVAWAGDVSMLGTDFKTNPEWLLDTHNPIQAQRGGGEEEGFFAVMQTDFSGESTALRPARTNMQTANRAHTVSRRTVLIKGAELDNSAQAYYDLTGRRVPVNKKTGKQRGTASSVLIEVKRK